MPIIRAKPFIQNLPIDISSPFFDNNGILHFLCEETGTIMMVDEVEKIQTVHSTQGMPSGAIFDKEGSLYVTDFAHGCVLAVQPETGEQDSLVGVYEDKPLKGPNTIAQDKFGNFYFSDSGPFGQTGLDNPSGSLFTITNGPTGQILKPLSLENLAYPSGVAVSPNGKFIYVAEQMKNRVLRFFQKPDGVFHSSVFCQLSGGVGPNAIAIDNKGNIYVAQYDVSDSGSEGRVLVLSGNGEIKSSIIVNGAEVSGLAVNEKYLYITEKSTATIYRLDI